VFGLLEWLGDRHDAGWREAMSPTWAQHRGSRAGVTVAVVAVGGIATVGPWLPPNDLAVSCAGTRVVTTH
jgi:hypothetical protein